MHVYHLVAQANVDPAGYVIEPALVQHGTLAHARVDALAGLIDPQTHLNLDFGQHHLAACVVVEALDIGAVVQWSTNGFLVAYLRPSAFSRLGPVNLADRRAAWQRALAASSTATRIPQP